MFGIIDHTMHLSGSWRIARRKFCPGIQAIVIFPEVIEASGKVITTKHDCFIPSRIINHGVICSPKRTKGRLKVGPCFSFVIISPGLINIVEVFVATCKSDNLFVEGLIDHGKFSLHRWPGRWQWRPISKTRTDWGCNLGGIRSRAWKNKCQQQVANEKDFHVVFAIPDVTIFAGFHLRLLI